jgi:circadian clock protein KaiB
MSKAPARPGNRFSFRLFVAGDSPNSARAVENLKALCDRRLGGQCDREVVDVFREPQRALADGILVTPTLIKLAPGPVKSVVGDLSQEGAVLLALGVSDVLDNE